jgi:hypothetical protein
VQEKLYLTKFETLKEQIVEKCHMVACLHGGSNTGPSVYKTDALPLSYKGDEFPGSALKNSVDVHKKLIH